MKETEFQKKLIDAAKAENGYGWKNDNKFLAGICDVTIIRGHTYFIECKIMKYKKLEIGHEIGIKTTPLQRKFLQAVSHAGAYSGTATLIQYDNVDYIYATKNWMTQVCLWGIDDFIRRRRGEPWPILKILDKLT